MRPFRNLPASRSHFNCEAAKIYTRRDDDATTGLYFGWRVPEDSPRPVAYGAVDEAQAAIGVTRAAANDPDLDVLLVSIGRGRHVVMAEVATAEDNHDKFVAG